MRILVTGGAGYVGSVCVEELLNAGHEVTVYDNLSEGHAQAVDPRARLIKGDLSEGRKLVKALKDSEARAVIHFAASALVGESMANPSKYFDNNVGNGIRLMEALTKTGVRRIVHSSSCATYGVPERVPISEETPQIPVSPYGQSKLMFEQILRWYDRIHAIAHVNLRYFNAAGASGRFGEDHREETHLIPCVLKVALGRAPEVRLFGNDYPTPDGTCLRDYVHVGDLASAHLRALETPKSDSINLGTGVGTTVMQVVDAARRITGHPIPVSVQPRREGDPHALVASISKARRVLGWEPQWQKIDDILASAWKWHQKHPDGYSE